MGREVKRMRRMGWRERERERESENTGGMRERAKNECERKGGAGEQRKKKGVWVGERNPFSHKHRFAAQSSFLSTQGGGKRKEGWTGWAGRGRADALSSRRRLVLSWSRVRFAAFVPGPRDHSGHSYFIYSIFYSIPYFYSRYSLHWWRAALWIDPLDCLTNRPVGWFAPLHFFYDLIYCDMTWYGSVGATAKWPGDMIVERTVKEKERVAIS